MTNVMKLPFQSGLLTFYTLQYILHYMFYYVCFGLLMQISLADYSAAYLHELKLVAHFDLSLDLFLCDF